MLYEGLDGPLSHNMSVHVQKESLHLIEEKHQEVNSYTSRQLDGETDKQNCSRCSKWQ